MVIGYAKLMIMVVRYAKARDSEVDDHGMEA